MVNGTSARNMANDEYISKMKQLHRYVKQKWRENKPAESNSSTQALPKVWGQGWPPAGRHAMKTSMDSKNSQSDVQDAKRRLC